MPFSESNPKMKNTPIKPIIIANNLLYENLSSWVIKWAKISAKIGPTDISKPAVLDWINCSDQLIRKNGIKFPKKPITRIIKIVFKSGLKLNFFILKYIYNTKAAIMRRPEATVTGSIVLTLILIAKNDEPQIADKIVRSEKIFDKKKVFTFSLLALEVSHFYKVS